MESLANLEGAAQIIDKYMDDILDQALNYTLNMFEDEDSTEFFGRKSRSGIEETIERVYTQLDVDLAERKEKVTSLVNLRYDQAAERLARAGLIEAGGITGSGTYMARLEQLETERAASIIEKELEADDWVRGELKEVATMLENLKTSMAAEEETRQATRLDTTSQLLDFVTKLEEVRLSERQVSVQEGALDLDAYNSAVDEKIRIAEQTGMLDGEETVVLREIYSRMELENRRLDLEAIWFDEEMDFNSRVQAFREVVDIKRIGLEARKMNLEETLGLAGLQLEERRLKLDQYLGEAGVALEERGLIIDMMLGEGDLNIRRDQLGIERDRLDSQSFVENQRLLIDQQKVDLEEKNIDNRYAQEEQRLQFDYFVEGNRTTLTLNDQKIQQERNDISRLNLDIEAERLEYEERRDILDRSLGFARLNLEGEALSLEDRKFVFDQMLQQRKLTLEEQRMAFEEVMFNEEMDLADRRLYLEGTIAKSNLDDADADRAVDWYLANAKVRQDDRSLDLQERDLTNREQERFINATGMYIDPDGNVQQTWKSKMDEEALRLEEMGLDNQANALTHEIRIFDEYTKPLLVLEQAEYQQKRHEFERRMSLESERLTHDINVALEANKIDKFMAEIQHDDVKNRADYNEKKLEYDQQYLQSQIRQQALERQADMERFEKQLNFDTLKFEDWKERDNREWAQSLKESAEQYGLDLRELELIEFKAQHDAAMANDDFESAAYAYAEAWGLPPDKVVEALNVARENRARVMDQYATDRGLSEEQLRQLRNANEEFEQGESRRDKLWAMVDAEDFDWSNPADRAEFTAMMNIANGTNTTFSGFTTTGEGGGQQGFVGYLSNLFGKVMIETLTGDGDFDLEDLMDKFPDLPWGDDEEGGASSVVDKAKAKLVNPDVTTSASTIADPDHRKNVEKIEGKRQEYWAEKGVNLNQEGAVIPKSGIGNHWGAGYEAPLEGVDLLSYGVEAGAGAELSLGGKVLSGLGDKVSSLGLNPSNATLGGFGMVAFGAYLLWDQENRADKLQNKLDANGLRIPIGYTSNLLPSFEPSEGRDLVASGGAYIKWDGMSTIDDAKFTNAHKRGGYNEPYVQYYAKDKDYTGTDEFGRPLSKGVLYEEPLSALVQRTGILPLSIDQFLNLPQDPTDPNSAPMYADYMDLVADAGLPMTGAYTPKDNWDNAIITKDGVLFTGTKQKSQNWKNTQFVPWEDFQSSDIHLNPDKYVYTNIKENIEENAPSSETDDTGGTSRNRDYGNRGGGGGSESREDFDFEKFPEMPSDMPPMNDFTTEENRIYTQALQASNKTDSSMHMDAYNAVMDYREKKRKEADEKSKADWKAGMDENPSGSEGVKGRVPFSERGTSTATAGFQSTRYS